MYVGLRSMYCSRCFCHIVVWMFSAYGFMLVVVVELGEFCYFRRRCGVYSDVVGCIRVWVSGICICTGQFCASRGIAFSYGFRVRVGSWVEYVSY